MDYLHDEINKYLSQDSINNINTNYSKIVGIESNLNILNENNKYVGIILLRENSPKLFLDMIVEFRTDKIKWRSSKFDGENGFYLIDPYWVKSYSPAPKIKVPIKVRVNDQIVVVMRELNYSQFQQSRLNEYYYKNKIPYTFVAAYKNFYKMNRPNQYYKAINSTVKNYFVNQDQLIKIISEFNQEKNRIKSEWDKFMNNFVNQSQSAKMINELFKNRKFEKESANVIKLKNLS